VGAYTFIGVNATTRDAITIGERCVIGAGAVILRDAADGEVYPAPRTRPGERRSDEIDF
jgi:acetyltransferase-like isoleucine patch superfamily enzyme